MSVQHDADGRRSVQAEVEVPGTPEQVWQAIATGPGISSWFVPSEVDERMAARDHKERVRKGLSEWAFDGAWGEAWGPAGLGD